MPLILQNLLSKGALQALTHRNYAIYAPFSFMASIGFWIQRISIQWLVWELTESFFWLGGIVLFEALAITFITPLAGVWVDQFSRVTIARITRLVTSLTAFLIATFVLLDVITLPILIACVMLGGLSDGAWTVTRLTIVPNLVPRKAMSHAITFEAISFQSTQFIGPAIAGIIIATFGVGFAFLTNTLLLSSVFFAFFFVKLDKSTRPPKAEGFFTRIADALNYVRERPGMIRLLILTAIFSLCLRPYKEFYAGLAEGVFNMGPEGLALMASASGIGAFTAALVIGSASKMIGLPRIILISSILTFISMLVYAISPTFPIVVAGALGLGFSQTLMGIGAQIMLQNVVEDSKRGRVMSLWGLQLRAIPSIGGFSIGAVAAWLDIRIALSLFAVLFLTAALIWIWPHRAKIIALK